MAAKKTGTSRKKKTSTRSRSATGSKRTTARESSSRATKAKRVAGAKKGAAITGRTAAAKKKSTAGKSTAKKGTAKSTASRGKTTGTKTAATRKKSAKAAARTAAPSRAPLNNRAGSHAVDASDRAPATKTNSRRRANSHLSARELRRFEKLLLNLRDQVVDEISFLTGDNLSGKKIERTGEEGTDNFNREFALKLVSSEQDVIYEIDEALRRLKNGTYGICEYSGEPIEKERLKVLPYARHSVAVQSELERGRTRYRPFGPTIPRAELGL